MKINLKKVSSLNKDARRRIYQDLLSQLIDEYDLDDYGTKEWIKSKSGQEEFIKWLTEKGYKVKTYSWPVEKEPRSAGLDFDDNDPLFVALKLKHFGDDQ